MSWPRQFIVIKLNRGGWPETMRGDLDRDAWDATRGENAPLCFRIIDRFRTHDPDITADVIIELREQILDP